MTEQTQPTDAEIEHLYLEETGFDLDESPAALRDFARAVLAKWGQPAQAAAPVAWYEYNADLDAWFLAYSHNPKAKTRPLVFGDTTPQPTQAQAGAVPLTVSQIRDWWASENGLEDCEMCKITDFLRVVRAVEEKHGIKEGGQHADR